MQIYYTEERHYSYLSKLYKNLLFTLNGVTIFTFHGYSLRGKTCKR